MCLEFSDLSFSQIFLGGVVVQMLKRGLRFSRRMALTPHVGPYELELALHNRPFCVSIVRRLDITIDTQPS